MHDPFYILLLAMLAYGAGGLLSLLLSCKEDLAIKVSGIGGTLGGLLGLWAVVPVLLSGQVTSHVYAGLVPLTEMPVRMDLLSAFMVAVISLLAVITSVYSLSYMRGYKGKGVGGMGFFMNIFIASMAALMVMDNAFYFIVFFELMSLSSYFLVIADQDEEAVSAGFVYFLIAHAGSVLILMAFFILFCCTPEHTLNFEDFRKLSLSPWASSAVFLLAFLGFGAKAGMLPLHGWLPRAHPAAPSHASAMMSGVMVKVGVFGVIKVGADLLGGGDIPLWWGAVVLGFGAVSAVLGVMYALAEHDIKRLLAYHTVENVGIILMGVGVGFMGLSQKNPVLAALGFLGALYHLLNHAVFKGLLFLGAGAVVHSVHSKDMEKMGGLAKRMPRTALAFLIGCMAISALPPLNGFVSEWYTYQALVSISQEGSALMQLAGPVGIVMLAITGALAAMCFVKVYGISFCGQARSDNAAEAQEAPACMTGAMLVLAALCVLLGVGAFAVTPVISGVANSLAARADALTAVQGMLLVPGAQAATALSPVLLTCLMAAAVVVPLLLFLYGKGLRLPMRRRDDPWACGYLYELRMAMSAGSFTQGLRHSFASLYSMRKTLDPVPALSSILAHTVNKVQGLQHGDFRIYCLYIIVALVVLLICKAV